MNHPDAMEAQARLLIVDDEEIFLLSTADLLRREGFLVDCARDVASALVRMETARYDVLISDISMPGNPDLEMLKRIPEQNTGLPVILVTGYPSGPSAIQAIGLSVMSYLVKPLEFQDLLAQVRKGVTVRRVQCAVQDSSRRIKGWAEELAALATQVELFPSGAGRLSMNQLTGIVLGRMAETLLDLKRLVDLGQIQDEATDPCNIHNCPRLEMYEQIMRDGIDTLERTKGAFKSRELGDLRQKLEQTVERR
jgi:FixJ family two-component response regulator